jgi:hypothetical protein
VIHGLALTNPEIVNKLGLFSELEFQEVEQKTLDDYFSQIEHHRTLIKIDTEGNELAVLEGATRTLKEVQPTIIFECNPGNERAKLFDFLGSRNYAIHRLPWSHKSMDESISSGQFGASLATNFIAVPISNYQS